MLLVVLLNGVIQRDRPELEPNHLGYDRLFARGDFSSYAKIRHVWRKRICQLTMRLSIYDVLPKSVAAAGYWERPRFK